MILHIFGYIFIGICIFFVIMGIITAHEKRDGYIAVIISCSCFMMLSGFTGLMLLGKLPT